MNHSLQSPSHSAHTRVVIVGAGPIGLELAVSLTRLGVDYEIVEAGAVGQTMTWWAPQTRWFSSSERIAIAGVPLLTPDQTKATREQYLTYLRSVVEQYEIRVHNYQPVVEIHRHNPGLRHEPRFTVVTQSQAGTRGFDCEAVVLATGGTDHRRRLEIEGEDLPHVDGYLREPHQYFGRRVLIIGGRNSAVEAALRLHHAGAEVSMSYRGERLPEDHIKYWLLPEIRGLTESGRIQAYWGTRPTRITSRHVVLESLAESDPAEPLQVPTDHVLSLIGYVQDKTLFQNAGLELIDVVQRPWVDEQTMESSVKGIYVAGTAVAGTQTSRYRLFLENCHEHVRKIVGDLTGQSLHRTDENFATEIAAYPES